MTPLALLRSPIAWGIAAAIAALLAVAIVYRKGETTGAADSAAAVARTTTVAIDQARKDKEEADEKVRTAAPDAVIDSTR